MIIAPYINHNNSSKKEIKLNKTRADRYQASTKKRNTPYLDDTVNEVISILVKRKNRIQKEYLYKLKKSKAGTAEIEKMKASSNYYSLPTETLQITLFKYGW